MRWLPSRSRPRRSARAWAITQVVDPLSRAAHRHHDLSTTVTMFGSRRSGTTWVQEVLSAGRGTCPIFEPLNPPDVVAALGFDGEPSVAPGTAAPEFAEYLASVMRGGELTRWSMKLATVRQVITARRFVVKHVQINLAAGWLVDAFPSSPSVIVVRHPCAVVQSMINVPWKAVSADSLLQGLSAEQRQQMKEVIDTDPTEVAVYAARWAVEVRALLRDTDPSRTALVSYEAAVDDPAGVLGAVMERTGLPRPSDLLTRASRPSRMAQKTSVTRVQGDPVSAWVEAFSVEERDEVLRVAERAGLVGFSSDPRPDIEALHEQHRRPREA